MTQEQRNRILSESDQLLEIFTEQYLALREQSGVIPLIEIDILKQTLQQLYKQIDGLHSRMNALDHTSDQPHAERKPAIEPVSQKQTETPVAVVAPSVPEAVSISSPESSPAPALSAFELPSEPPASSPTTVEQPLTESLPVTEMIEVLAQTEAALNTSPEMTVEVIAPKAVEMQAPIIESRQENFKVSAAKAAAVTASLFDDQPVQTVAAKFKEQDTVYKKIASSQTDQSLAGKLQQGPLVDLRKSIGINERFAFINELFAGNQQQYSEQIEKLNAFSNYAEARALLYDELATKLNWKTSSTAFEKLDNLVKRRFGI